MSKRQFVLGMLLSSLMGGLIVLFGLSMMDNGQGQSVGYNTTNLPQTTKFDEISKEPREYIVPEGINFVKASNEVVPAVVHITNTQLTSGRYGRFLRGDRRGRQSTGSGVIISEDGYIVTNNHVVEDADELEVRLDDNRRIRAELIGTDKDTDLALIKVDAGSLPYVGFGDSDQVEIGEWVLAVGNPFDLNNTVTAGIVSAKARNINLITSATNRYGIESFIQTDAVVNRGNSGGALVNLEGELIGINTAIATNTGTFNGYSFAVPSILVKKVMDDLLEFGVVQRGLLGVSIRDADGRGTNELSGVLISQVNEGGAADEAGLRSDDVIIAVGDREVKTTSELQELIARHRPGDNVQIKYKRGGDINQTSLILKNLANSTEVVVKEIPLSFEIEGAKFHNIDDDVKRRFRIRGGAKLVELGSGAWRKSGVKEGFIITKVGDESISDITELEEVLQTKTKDFYVMGRYPNGEKEYFRIDWD